jgi:hypothetical protein
MFMARPAASQAPDNADDDHQEGPLDPLTRERLVAAGSSLRRTTAE